MGSLRDQVKHLLAVGASSISGRKIKEFPQSPTKRESL